MSWNILNIFVYHVDIIKWHGKIFSNNPWNILPHHIHRLFWNQQCLIDFEHGFGQESCWEQHHVVFRSKTKMKDAFYHPSCNQCSKCLMLLNNNYNIFKNVKMGGNCILEKYLMKIKFSKYIKYMISTCQNGRSIIHKYTSLYNDWKVTKWRKKPLSFTRI